MRNEKTVKKFSGGGGKASGARLLEETLVSIRDNRDAVHGLISRNKNLPRNVNGPMFREPTR
jgi:hypothetical protein